MQRDNDQKPDRKPDLPKMPESPDPERVRELREQMRGTRPRQTSHADLLTGRLGDENKRLRARDLGTYTMIPMLMLAGPGVGYGLGYLAQRQWGGEPWPVVAGVLLGMLAGFRQVFLLMAGIQKRNRNREK
jgi:F0F1-type ATP synthase assembly protein I